MTNSQNVQIPPGNLIPIFTAEIGGVAVLAVYARELHQFLGAKRDFSSWIKKRLAENKCVEGEDFTFTKTGEPINHGMQDKEVSPNSGENLNAEILIHQNGGIKNQHGGDRRSIDYILELNTAKELAMQEKSDKGRMVRKYFIECERKIHEVHEIPSSQEINDRLVFIKAVRKRVLFWTLEKRDRIVHPGIDRHALFSITMDIRAALANELIDDTVLFFPTSHQNDPELIKFVNEWVPEFFREIGDVA